MYQIQIMINGTIISKDITLFKSIEPLQRLNNWYVLVKFIDGVEGYYCFIGELNKSLNKKTCEEFIKNTLEIFEAYLKNIEQKNIRNKIIKTFLKYPKNKDEYLETEKDIKSLEFQLVDYNKHNQRLKKRMNLLRSRQIAFLNKI